MNLRKMILFLFEEKKIQFGFILAPSPLLTKLIVRFANWLFGRVVTFILLKNFICFPEFIGTTLPYPLSSYWSD